MPTIDTSAFVVAPTKYGPMIINPLDKYIGHALAKYGQYSDLEVTTLTGLVPEGGVAFDIGANLGVMALALAKKVGPTGTIMAVEPQRLIYNALCGTMALNDIFHCHCVLGAVGAEAGTVYVPTLHPVQSLNFGAVSLIGAERPEAGEGGAAEPRPVYRLDDIGGFHRLDLIKVDVEGMETKVLAGAVNLIMKFRPVLYLENDRPEQKDELESMVNSLGYIFTWHCPPLFSFPNHNDEPDNIYQGIHAQNILCVPRSQREGFEMQHGPTAWVNA